MPNRDTTGTGGTTPTGSTTGQSTAGSSSTTANTPPGGRGSVDDIKKSVNHAADDAMETGHETLGQAQGRIRSLLEQQTGRAADQLGGVANALHKAAEQLNQENGGVVADYAVQAADRVERVADMLRDATVDDIVGEVEGFARRQPEVFIGAAFAVGFLAARFIKSSGERQMHRASTSLRGNTHPSQSVRSTRSSAYDVGRDRSSDMNRDSDRKPSRGMAGGIAESVSRGTPSHSADTPTTGSSTVNTGNLAGRMESERGAERLGEPKPAAGRIGMPLSTAPASVTGRGASPSADTALGTSTVGTPAGVSGTTGSTANAGTTGTAGTQGGAAGTTSSTSKPQGQRP
ncbi:hypothetical protein [Azospirillum lipoferum]|uniref:Nutrient deprivation-induced protein n=1 Tax=Azospirillum lipoferum (strain 4B) TaxID=862719 RepID=G7ZF68_AZOL4|nr:hypothetical protein [Azospirillum lipoferum]CBS90087.1 protein of unknown function [Azospirillum lipoferum 4B]